MIVPQIKIIKPKVEILTPEGEIREFPKRIEIAGRTCYKSEDRITEDSAEKFVKMLIGRGHESVLEHCSITARFICSRGASHQLVRHRLGAYSQESTRYCNYGKSQMLQVIPPEPLANAFNDETIVCFDHYGNVSFWQEKSLNQTEDFQTTRWCESVLISYENYLYLIEDGWKPEDARSILPTNLKTEVVATFNLRQWRHVFQERALNPHAQAEIRNLMVDLLTKLSGILPCIFGDLTNGL